MVNQTVLFRHVNLLLAQTFLQVFPCKDQAFQVTLLMTLFSQYGLRILSKQRKRALEIMHWLSSISSPEWPSCSNPLARISYSLTQLQRGLRNTVFCLPRKGRKTKMYTSSAYYRHIWKMFLQASFSLIFRSWGIWGMVLGGRECK